jgi:lipoate-protein ligase B
VDNDLQPFEWIVPCGIEHARMTSVLKETGSRDMACFRKRMAFRFAEALGSRQRIVSMNRLVAGEPHYRVSPSGSPLVGA